MAGARKHALMILIIATLGTARAATAQVFHQYPGAPVVGDTQPALGAAFGVGDNLVRLVGYGRFNVSEVSDFGVEIALDHWDAGDGGWRFGAGADFKHAIIPSETELPFDLSAAGGLGFQTGNDVTNISIPAGAVISRPLELQGGRVLVPYGALYLVYSHVSVDVPPGAPDVSDSDLDIELRLGTSLEFGAGISGFINVHIGNDEMFFIGMNSSL